MVNFGFETPPGITFVFAVQPELRETLHYSQFLPLRQRTSISYPLQSMGADETCSYIHHHTSICGKLTCCSPMTPRPKSIVTPRGSLDGSTRSAISLSFVPLPKTSLCSTPRILFMMSCRNDYQNTQSYQARMSLFSMALANGGNLTWHSLEKMTGAKQLPVE
jgi:hypothetical protein